VRDALLKAGLGFNLNPGDVITVKDREIKFPLTIGRRPHERRFCLVLMNNWLCVKSNIILIAPMTHDLSVLSMAQLEFPRTKENGLEKDSRLILDQIQPIPKDAVLSVKGKLSDDEWECVMKKIVWILDRA
jgi:mRNA-degrading endonuclease toxin of MazEF toxin-antitoxin module